MRPRATPANILCLGLSMLFATIAMSQVGHEIPPQQPKKERISDVDGVAMACYPVALKKQWDLVEKDKYRKIENYYVTFVERKDDVVIVFDPKRGPDDDPGLNGGISSLGLGFEITVNKASKKVTQVALVP